MSLSSFCKSLISYPTLQYTWIFNRENVVSRDIKVLMGVGWSLCFFKVCASFYLNNAFCFVICLWWSCREACRDAVPGSAWRLVLVWGSVCFMCLLPSLGALLFSVRSGAWRCHGEAIWYFALLCPEKHNFVSVFQVKKLLLCSCSFVSWITMNNSAVVRTRRSLFPELWESTVIWPNFKSLQKLSAVTCAREVG